MEEAYEEPPEGTETWEAAPDTEALAEAQDEEQVEQGAEDINEAPAAQEGEDGFVSEFPPVPHLGPSVNTLGRIKALGERKTSGEIETTTGEIVKFEALNVIGGKEPSVRDHVAFAFEQDESGTFKATVVCPLQVHQGSPVNVELAKVKSYSLRNRYGFVQMLDDKDTQDVHFTSAVCTLAEGVQKDRICAVQVDRSVDGRPRCCFLQPLMEQHEVQEMRAAVTGNAQLVAVTGEEVAETLPMIDLSTMDLPANIITNPEVILCAQNAAADAARNAAAVAGTQPHSPLQQSGFSYSYPYGSDEPQENPEDDNTVNPAGFVGTHHGTVKSWSSVNKYGFIKPDSGGRDVHVQLSSLGGMPALNPGERVSFTYDTSELPRRRAASVWNAAPPAAPLQMQSAPPMGQIPPPPGPGMQSSNKAPRSQRPMAPYSRKPRPGGNQGGGDSLPPPPPPPPGKQGANKKPGGGTSSAGSVKSYYSTKGYGFIVCDNTQKDIFFSAQQVTDAGLPAVRAGDRLGFSTASNETRASQVWGI